MGFPLGPCIQEAPRSAVTPRERSVNTRPPILFLAYRITTLVIPSYLSRYAAPNPEKPAPMTIILEPMIY
jgi:hypothetical protein